MFLYYFINLAKRYIYILDDIRLKKGGGLYRVFRRNKRLKDNQTYCEIDFHGCDISKKTK